MNWLTSKKVLYTNLDSHFKKWNLNNMKIQFSLKLKYCTIKKWQKLQFSCFKMGKICYFWNLNIFLKWLFIFGNQYENMWNLLFLLCVKFQLFPGFPTNLKNHHFREKYDELCPNGGPVNMKSEFQIFFHTVTETQTLLTQRLNLAKFEKPQCGNFMIFLSLRFYLKSIMGVLNVVF